MRAGSANKPAKGKKNPTPTPIPIQDKRDHRLNLGVTKAMDRTKAPERKLSFCHLSHDHPLRHTNSPPKESSLCSACNLNISSGNNKDYYSCKTCPFFLHNACHDMPRMTQHPARPTHHLTLQVSPSPSVETLTCDACGDHINGFYYSCSECSLCCYHVLCSSLPLSVSVSSHTHELKLTFSPPYNFSCDICRKPSYNGWLYRCQICEFDTHLFCAIYNWRPQSFPTGLNGESQNRASADYGSECDEVMQLLATQALLCHREESVNGKELLVRKDSISGWDFRLNSPKENTNSTSTQFIVGPLDQTEANIGFSSPNPGKPFLHQSPQTPFSDDMSTIPSYQFSDACFSIDLAKSYSSNDPMNKARTEANDDQCTKGMSSGPEVEGTRTDSHKNAEKPYSKPSNFGQDQKQQSYGTNNGSGFVYALSMGRDERQMKEAFLVRSDTLAKEELGQLMGKKSKANETKGRSAIPNQNSRSNTVSICSADFINIYIHQLNFNIVTTSLPFFFFLLAGFFV